MIISPVIAVIFTLVLEGSPDAKGPVDERAVLDQLESLREKNWTTGIHTLRADVEYMRLQEDNNKTISYEAFDNFVRGLENVWFKTKSFVSVRAYSATLPIVHPEKNFPNCWLSGTIIQRDDEVRNQFKANLVPGANPEDIDISYYKGATVYSSYESSQVSIFENGSQWKIFTLGDLRFAPKPLRDFEVTGISGDTVTLKRGQLELVVEKSTSSIVRLTHVQSNEVLEERQFGFRRIKGVDGSEVLFPTVAIKARFKEKFLRNCYAFFIKDLTFNDVIPDQDFKVPVMAGTNVFLYSTQAQRKSVASIRPREVTWDAQSLLPKLRQRARPAAARPNLEPVLPKRSTLKWLILANVAVMLIIVVGVVGVRRWKRRDVE